MKSKEIKYLAIVSVALLVCVGVYAYFVRDLQKSDNSAVSISTIIETSQQTDASPAKPVSITPIKSEPVQKKFYGRIFSQISDSATNQTGVRYEVGIYPDAMSARYAPVTSTDVPTATVVVNSTTTLGIGSSYLFNTSYDSSKDRYDVLSANSYRTSGSDE